MSHDLALSLDLAVPPDLGPLVNLCEGLRGVADGGVATNCAVEFFAHFMSCFHPSGACTTGRLPPGVPNRSLTCWANGSSLLAFGTLGFNGVRYESGERICGSHTQMSNMPVDYSACTSADDCTHGTADAGARSKGSYDGNIFTCPDGTPVNIGPHLGDCADLNALFDADAGCTDIGNITSDVCP